MLKSQAVRLVDVAVIGPVMIWAGVDLRKKRPWLAALLGVFGVATIGYNARNYWRYQQLTVLPPPSLQQPVGPGMWT